MNTIFGVILLKVSNRRRATEGHRLGIVDLHINGRTIRTIKAHSVR